MSSFMWWLYALAGTPVGLYVGRAYARLLNNDDPFEPIKREDTDWGDALMAYAMGALFTPFFILLWPIEVVVFIGVHLFRQWWSFAETEQKQ